MDQIEIFVKFDRSLEDRRELSRTEMGVDFILSSCTYSERSMYYDWIGDANIEVCHNT